MRDPRTWLIVGMLGYFVVSFALSWLRSVEFQTTTWDQGVYQQAIWMSSHGRPFYETADVETGGYGSLLDVHSVFLLYLVVPLYAVLPYQTTLFAVQSAVVAIAAVPMYLLTKDLSRSARWGLVGGLAYLAWTPVLSANLYDFHAEAFLPVELFTLVLLWEREQYRWGFLAAAVAFSTMELAPVLTFFVGVFFLIAGEQSTHRIAASHSGLTDGRSAAVRLRAWLGRPRVLASFGLMAASAVAYAFLLYLRVDYLPAALGTYPLPVPATGYVIGASPAGLQLSLANLEVALSQKLSYWLVAVALLAFIPFFAPRALVLSVPWFAFTLLSSNANYAMLGFQYGFIAAASLLVAFAYGLPEARRWVSAMYSRWWQGRGHGQGRPSSRRGRASRRRVVAGTVALVALLAVNLAGTPLNPAMDNHDLGSAYRIFYSPNPGDAQVPELVSLMPKGATVVASDNLFPLVANDANAYSFSWVSDPALALPFNASHLPTYVLVSQLSVGAVTPWIAADVENPAAYGVRGVVWASDAGIVTLYETGYAGAPVEFGTPARG